MSVYPEFRALPKDLTHNTHDQQFSAVFSPVEPQYIKVNGRSVPVAELVKLSSTKGMHLFLNPDEITVTERKEFNRTVKKYIDEFYDLLKKYDVNDGIIFTDDDIGECSLCKFDIQIFKPNHRRASQKA
jgi:hypothetical protein